LTAGAQASQMHRMRTLPLRFVTLAGSFAILIAAAGPLGCSGKHSPPDSSRTQPSATSSSTVAAPAPVASTATPPGNDRAARKAQYCARHDAMKHLMTPKCQACLKGPPPKDQPSCLANGTAFKACARGVPEAKNRSSLQCAMGCGVQCACSLECFEKDLPDCMDSYLATLDCVATACEAACK
jgi:hypothetical protein